MVVGHISRFALASGAAAVLLAGCAVPSQTQDDMQRPIAVPGVMARVPRPVTPSWMAPDATKGDLMYVSSEMNWEVDVFSYPGGKREGELSGTDFLPLSLCSDKRGDVFIPNAEQSDILEYAHGGTTPIATLYETGQSAEACAVDPATGDLAVDNVTTNGGEAGSIAIYKNASGSPQTYSIPNMYLPYECGYDDHSNLFVAGLTTFTGVAGGKYVFAELPKGGSAFSDVTIHAPIKLPGGVQWDGKSLAVGDSASGIIYRTNGAGGKVSGKTKLRGSDRVLQFWIQGNDVAAPSYYSVHTDLWKYPAGGRAIGGVTVASPWGVTVSVRPK